jgi:hypothetical protein
MNRRQFLHGSLGAALVVPSMAERATAAQTPAPPARASSAPRKLVLDVSSRSLHWLRSPEQVADAAVEMVVGGVCPTVMPYPGHIEPAQVAQQLPAFAKAVRSRGLRMTQIKGPAIRDITEPHAEAIIGAAAQAGCTHYSLGGYTYDLGKPLQPQLDAIKLRIERFVRLNQKHRMTLVYHTLPGPTSVGGVVLDLLPIFRSFDPRYVGFQWDTGHMAMHGDGMWETLMRLAGPYVASVAWRDRGWVQDLGLKGEGGPYAGPVPRVEPLVTRPDGSAVPGTPAAAAPAAPAGQAPAAPAARAGGAGAGGRGGGGRGGGGRAAGPARGPANSAGAGSIDNANPLYRSIDGEMPKRPIGGLNAKGAGWSAPNVAMGTGVVHIPRVATVLAEIGFNGPSELQSEYAGIGGAESGADKITLPRQFVIGLLKRDVITIRKSFEMANVGVAI